MKHMGIEIKFYNLDTFKKQIDVFLIDLDSKLVDLNYKDSCLIFCHFWRSIDQKRRKTDTCTGLVPLDCSRIFASLGIFLSPKRYFSSLLRLLFFILIVYSVVEKFFNVFSCSKQINGDSILQNGESFIAMKHDGSCCEDFLKFRHSKVVKSSFCPRFFIFLSCK